MICDEHSKIFVDTLEYDYENRGVKETMNYTHKNIADKVAVQLQRQRKGHGIQLPCNINRIDIIHGGDHGCGEFIAGARVCVNLTQLSQTTGTDDGDVVTQQSFTFEIFVAEIICHKDNTEIILLSIRDELTRGLEKIQS